MSRSVVTMFVQVVAKSLYSRYFSATRYAVFDGHRATKSCENLQIAGVARLKHFEVNCTMGGMYKSQVEEITIYNAFILRTRHYNTLLV